MDKQDKQLAASERTKWYKTRKCGCDECRFFSLEERPECPMKNEPTAIWLWAMHEDMIGVKDYIDPLDFQEPISYIEKPALVVIDKPLSTFGDFSPDH